MSVAALGNPKIRWVVHHALCRAHRLSVEGIEYVPPTGRVIVATNHVGVRGGTLLSDVLPRETIFIGSLGLLRTPVVREVVCAYGGVFASPADMLGTQFLDDAGAVLDAGAMLGIMVDGGLMDMRRGRTKRGAVYLAARLSAQVLPVYVHFVGPVAARISVGMPLPAPPSVSRRDLDSLTAALDTLLRARR